MYTIGEMSKLVKLSAETLRHYDRIQLLKPHKIDEHSKYRYYSGDQVRDIFFIMEMKAFGFSLDAIRELLQYREKEEQLRHSLLCKQEELLSEKESLELTINRIMERIRILNQGADDGMNVTPAVYIVDDVGFMRTMLREIVESRGCRVVGEASGGEEAVQAFRGMNANTVIMDIHMPGGMNGLEAARAMKEEDPSVKIIMCSAKGQPDVILNSLHLGADAFIVKPFQAEFLLRALFDSSYPMNAALTELIADVDLAVLPSDVLDQKWIDRLFELRSIQGKELLKTKLFSLIASLQK